MIEVHSATREQVRERIAPYYAGKRILVTGGASFIGSHLVEFLLNCGATVWVADDLSSGRREHLARCSDSVELLVGDLRDPEFAGKAAKGSEIVFHLAASHGGRGFIDTHPVECVNNMALDNTLFSSAVAAGANTIVHASSACVYPTVLQDSETDRKLLREEDANFEVPGAAFSDGEYGWAKLMSELQLNAFHKQFGINAIGCRIFTTYGERENESHAVVALIAKALAKRDPYPIWGSGRQTRNFTYVADTVTGMAAAGALLRGFDVLNVGTRRHETIDELCEAIFEYVDWTPVEIDYQLDKPVGVLSRAADNTKMRSLTGWEPDTSLSAGISSTIEYCRSVLTPDRLDSLDQRLMTR